MYYFVNIYIFKNDCFIIDTNFVPGILKVMSSKHANTVVVQISWVLSPIYDAVYLVQHIKLKKFEGNKPKQSRWTGYEPDSQALLLIVIYNITIFQNSADEMNLFIIWTQLSTQKKKEQKRCSHFIKVNYSIKTIWTAFSKQKHWKRTFFMPRSLS